MVTEEGKWAHLTFSRKMARLAAGKSAVPSGSFCKDRQRKCCCKKLDQTVVLDNGKGSMG